MPVVKIITNLGGTLFLILIAVALVIIIKNKKTGITILANLGISAILNNLLKIIIQRPRPIEHRLIEETGYSFPSGHSMISMAFYGYLAYLTYKYIKNKNLKYTIIILLNILILSIGISRIFLGVHYTSDVLAGFIISIIYLCIYIKSVEKTNK